MIGLDASFVGLRAGSGPGHEPYSVARSKEGRKSPLDTPVGCQSPAERIWSEGER